MTSRNFVQFLTPPPPGPFPPSLLLLVPTLLYYCCKIFDTLTPWPWCHLWAAPKALLLKCKNSFCFWESINVSFNLHSLSKARKLHLVKERDKKFNDSFWKSFTFVAKIFFKNIFLTNFNHQHNGEPTLLVKWFYQMLPIIITKNTSSLVPPILDVLQKLYT